MYKQASKLALRVATPKGMLSVEQLWQLSLTDLSNSIKAVKQDLVKTSDDELSFLEEGSSVDPIQQLRFDILKDVYLTKKADNTARLDAIKTKEHNQKILSIIAEKEEGKLQEMSIEQLRDLLK